MLGSRMKQGWVSNEISHNAGLLYAYNWAEHEDVGIYMMVDCATMLTFSSSTLSSSLVLSPTTYLGIQTYYV